MSSQGQGTLQSTKRFSQNDLKTIESSENEQRQFKEFVVASKIFSETEKVAIELDSVADFSAFWEQANDAKGTFDRDHEKGCGLWSKRYQSSAVLVQGFMNDFSPIIQIVKDFAAPYGGMAVGTMSVLFAVARNKDEMEDRIASVISAIKDRLPGLKLYQHIYNENHELDVMLQVKIVSAYQGFIDFCIAATKYYKSGGPRRWLRALGGLNSFKGKVDNVQNVMVEIRHLCEELLDKNVDSIKKLTIEQAEHITDLEREVKQLHQGLDNKRLNEIQRLLNLDAFSEELLREEVTRYRQALDSDDQLNAEYFEQMRERELDLFKRRGDYQLWIQSEKSCLLILSGYNDESISAIDQCWLSPVAMATIDDLSQHGSRPIYAYYLFPQRGKILLHDVLPVILLQLLRQKSHALRDEKQHAELCAELYKLREYEELSKKMDEKHGVNEDDRVSALYKVAVRVINFFDESETVWIIVDRADRCSDGREADHRKALLKAFVKMVEKARSKLRVLTVINGYSWPVENHQDELGEKVKERVIVHTSRQRRLDL